MDREEIETRIAALIKEQAVYARDQRRHQDLADEAEDALCEIDAELLALRAELVELPGGGPTQADLEAAGQMRLLAEI